MDKVEEIRRMFFNEGKSISEINRLTGVDKKTLRKYIRKTDFNAEQKQIKLFGKLNPFMTEIDSWLEQDIKEKKKQRHTAKRVFDRIKENYPDADISYRSIAYYVKDKKRSLFEPLTSCSLPLEHKPGEAQVDFGSADFIERNKRCEGHYLTVSFPFSNTGYTQIFKGENFECFAFGMKTIFTHIKGVPHRQWFDNAKPLVTKILRGQGRKLTDSFIRFKEHYNFTAVFCNPNAGNEKGNVENKVGYIRRNMLVPVPKFDDIAKFNEELLWKCDEDVNRLHYSKNINIFELFKEDLKYLNPMPLNELDAKTLLSVRTDGYGKFVLDKKSYSSSPKLALSTVSVLKTHNEIIVLDKDLKEVVRHERLYGQETESFNWVPYLLQLSRKPAALKYTGVYSMLPESVKSFLEVGNKSKFLKLLAELTEETDFKSATCLIEEAINYGTYDLDSVISLKRSYSGMPELPQVESYKVPELKIDLEKYDGFLEGTWKK